MKLPKTNYGKKNHHWLGLSSKTVVTNCIEYHLDYLSFADTAVEAQKDEQPAHSHTTSQSDSGLSIFNQDSVGASSCSATKRKILK